MNSHDDDSISNFSDNPTFASIVEQRLSRRAFVQGGLSTTLLGFMGSLGLVSYSDFSDTPGEQLQHSSGTPEFKAVGKSLADHLVLPPGYRGHVLYALGDPIAPDISEYAGDGSDTDFDHRSGDQHDGMHYFGLSGSGEPDNGSSARGLLCVNHEQLLDQYLHPAGPTVDPSGKRPRAEVDKEMNAHGVSVIEIAHDEGGAFQVVRDSRFNRRITVFTEMEIHGPARGNPLLATAYARSGIHARGTLNNCANGFTAWGTYLTCEENWFGYFRRGADSAIRTTADNALLARYGMEPDTAGPSYRNWDSVPGDEYLRFDITATGAVAAEDYRNEPSSFGYVVEIDPFDPGSAPRKRSALGRLGHEGCWPAAFVEGRPVVFYMGDDSHFEYIYKFVSSANFDPRDRGLAAGDKYLNSGTLYVARFNEDGSGIWIALTQGANGLDAANTLYPFADQAAVCVATRLAADAVGATKMDRPEWGVVNPLNGEVYMTLTNNANRTVTSTAAGENAANPRVPNVNGHIIRWREADGNPAALAFEWDIYLFGAPSDAGADVNLSGLDADNDFSSPDGLWFDLHGRLWIRTDDSAYTDHTNNQMLVALPGAVGDEPGERAGKLRRFLVGPTQCEITGVNMTPDGRTLFVNVQHPGEDGTAAAPSSHWPHPDRDATKPGPAGNRPRSATVVITREDGGMIGA